MDEIRFPILYKYTNSNSVQQWEIVVKDNTYYTIEGIQGGTLTTSKPTVCTGKNIGKVNETSPNQQAKLEAQSKWQKKKDKGYNEILTYEKKFFEPMLAFEREKYEHLLFTVPTYVQPKLDGVRCILKDGKLWSRNGKQIVSCPHLEIPGWFLDGELYSHDLKEDFNKIISLTRKSKPTQEDIEESKKLIQFVVYDYPALEEVYSERYEEILTLIKSKKLPYYFRVVQSNRIFSAEHLQQQHEHFLSFGFEGTMIRLDLGPYENKRSKQLLKYKNFQDAEFLILDIIEGEGNRSGMAGKLIVQLPEGTCGVSMTGTQEFMTQVLKDKEKIIGKEATVKFFGWTPDKSLRFPTLKAIIDYD